jgi:hypothetical protein
MVGRLWALIVGASGRLIALVAGALTLGGAVAVLLAGGGSQTAVRHRAHAASHPTTPPGSIVYARDTGSGVFHDSAGPFTVTDTDGAVLGSLQAASSCCFGASPTPRLLTAAVGGKDPARPVVVTSNGWTAVARPRGAATLHLVPGAISEDAHMLAMSGTDRVRPAADGIYIEALPSGTVRRVTHTTPGHPQRALSFSPDGTRLLIFRHTTGVFGSIEVVSAGGGRITRVGHTESTCCYFGPPGNWSPDGLHITYAGFVPNPGQHGDQSAVFVANAEGGHVRRITDWGVWTTSARWSPVGDWIAFDRVNTGDFHDEFLVRPNGSALSVLDTHTVTGGSCCAEWSPDGRDLVYEHEQRNGNVALWVMNAFGAPQRRRVTDTLGTYLSFAWVR